MKTKDTEALCWFDLVVAIIIIIIIINIFVKRHRQSYRGAVNESIRRR